MSTMSKCSTTTTPTKSGITLGSNCARPCGGGEGAFLGAPTTASTLLQKNPPQRPGKLKRPAAAAAAARPSLVMSHFAGVKVTE